MNWAKIKNKWWYTWNYPQDITATLWCTWRRYHIMRGPTKIVWVDVRELSHGHVTHLDQYLWSRIQDIEAGRKVKSTGPVVVTKDNVVVDGNGRVAAYKYLGKAVIKVIKEKG